MTQVINPLLSEEYYEKYLKSIKLPYERDSWQIEIGKAKIALKDAPLYLRETVDRRGRGASKTFDTMEQNLFLAVIGYRGIWFSSGRDQLEQPKIYLKYIIDRSEVLRSQISELLKESVEFISGGTLKLKNLTELNARSGRADFITYDEEAQADEDAYNAAVSILAGSNLGFVFHISTPAKATVFEKNYDRVRDRERKTGIKLTFKVIWDQASWLRAKSEWYEEQKRIQPGWYFRQEHEACFELPMGAIFQNVIYEPHPEWIMSQIKNMPLCSGVDWNPVSGHWLVSGKWTLDYMNFVIEEEHDIGQGYAVDMNIVQFNILATHMSKGKRLVLEEGGYNEEYITWWYKMLAETGFNHPEQQWELEEWDSQGVAKLKAATYLIQNGVTIYVDRIRFPNLAKMIEDCQWDADSPEPKIKKDKANSPHALDAFLHAISEKNREGGAMRIRGMF